MNLAQLLYNTFFYPSVCHMCKKYNGVLKQCAGCRMIGYCSREHQKVHWPEHKDLCRTIQHVRETSTAELSESQRTSSTMNLLMEKVKLKLERPLKHYEEEMFKFPRMCLVCYKVSGELKDCPHCMTVWFCAQHKNNHDSTTCDLLKLCFEIDTVYIHQRESAHLTEAYMRVTSYDKEFSNMKEFINIYGNIKGIQVETPPHLLEIKQSEFLTRPLTLLYGMRILNYINKYEKKKPELVIHVVAAYVGELSSLREWEILLHIFPTLKYLKVVLIGPMQGFMKEQTVCNTCKRNKKSFLVECQNTEYGNYVNKYLTLTQPNLVIRFCTRIRGSNDDLNLYHIWVSSLKYIARHNCPVLVSYSEENNTLDKVINTELNRTIEFRSYKNPFASLRPDKDYNDNSGYSVCYENTYLNVYKTLCP